MVIKGVGIIVAYYIELGVTKHVGILVIKGVGVIVTNHVDICVTTLHMSEL